MEFLDRARRDWTRSTIERDRTEIHRLRLRPRD
jgi:hypothetical protein